MSNGVQFDEIPRSNYNTYENDSRGLAEKIINLSGGIIKTKKQAEYFLVAFSLVVIVFSFILFKGDDKKYSAGEFPVIPAMQTDIPLDEIFNF